MKDLIRKYLKRFSCIIITSCLIVSIASAFSFSSALSPLSPNEQTSGDSTDLKESASVQLSDYTGEHSFTDRKAICAIAEAYGLQDPESIEEIIYVPIQQITVAESDDDLFSASAPSTEAQGSSKSKYYAKKNGSEEKKG